jgi:hypothetical protein
LRVTRFLNALTRGLDFVTSADRETHLVSADPGAPDSTVVLRGTGGSEVPASKLPPQSWLSPWRQMVPDEVAWTWTGTTCRMARSWRPS